MTPHETAKRQVLAEWLRRADEDLGLAEHLLGESLLYPNAIAFHCQQAAEKYLKALLVWREVSFPKTHDIKALLNVVQTIDSTLAKSLQNAVALTPYGVELRYPGDRPDTTPQDAAKAVVLARQVRDGVMRALPLT